MKRECIRSIVLTVLVSVSLLSGCVSGWEIDNPYENVNWGSDMQYKANLHTHTTISDGRFSPQDVVDQYHQLAYNILAITDHNEVSFPWTSFSQFNHSIKSQERLQMGMLDSTSIIYEDRDPEKVEMFAIQGNEVSSTHHMGSLFNDYQELPEDEAVAIKEIGKKEGLIILNHPGRHTERQPEKFTIDWYVSIFQSYEHVTGMEVFNSGNRYPNDRELWDSVLVRTLPERSVWGYSNDDFHKSGLGRNWNIFILPGLNEETIRQGMSEGKFLYVYASEGHNGPEIPLIHSVDINQRRGEIEINVTGQDSIRWISGGNVVYRGNSITLSMVPDLQKYVRAEIFGPKSITGTQPFGIR